MFIRFKYVNYLKLNKNIFVNLICASKKRGREAKMHVCSRCKNDYFRPYSLIFPNIILVEKHILHLILAIQNRVTVHKKVHFF